jgi:hypothetical protein
MKYTVVKTILSTNKRSIQGLDHTFLSPWIPHDRELGHLAYSPSKHTFCEGHKLPQFSIYAARIRAAYWNDERSDSYSVAQDQT